MQVSDVDHHPPVGKRDHNVIYFKYYCYLDYTKPKARYIYGKADFDVMGRNLMDTNWEEQYIKDNGNKSVAESWQYLKSNFTDLRNIFYRP